jgi:hypothetical protein
MLRVDGYVFAYGGKRIELTNFNDKEVRVFINIEYSDPQEINKVVYNILPDQTIVVVGSRRIARLELEACQTSLSYRCTNYSF